MKVPKGPLSVSFVAFVAVGSASAQTPPGAAQQQPTKVQVGVGVPIAVPVGEFGRHVDVAGGLSLALDVGLGDSIVSVGGEASYLWYGTDSRKVDLGPAIPELSGVFVTVTTDNAMVLVHGRLRVQPHRGRWRPYVDALYGFDYIYTKTSLGESTGCSGYSCPPGIEATNLGDWVPSFGAGAGVMVGLRKSPNPLRLDVSLRYLRGGEADYLTEGAIQRVGSDVVLDVSRSRTDTVALYVGISFGHR